MSNSTTLLDTIAANQASKEVVVNALMDAASPAMLWGRHASACSGLTWGYYGGNYQAGATSHAIANGTVTLTASTTNYVYANATTGAVSVNTTGFPGGSIPLYSVVTGTTTATSYTDFRSYQPSASSGGGGSSTLAGLSDVSITSPASGQVLTYNGTQWVNGGSYDVGGFVAGTSANSEIVSEFYSPRAWTLPSGASGGAKAGTAATGSTTYTIAKNGTSIGTLAFSASGTTGTVSITSSTSFAAGDVLSLTAPATADATLANIAFTLAGVR